jgi:hypothetical protein
MLPYCLISFIHHILRSKVFVYVERTTGCWNRYTLNLVSFIPWIDYVRTFSMHVIFRTSLGYL